MALGLARAGASVVVTAARERAEIEDVAREAERTCGEARVLPALADVTQEDDCARIVETTVNRFGRLDILVNNAGRGMKYVSSTFLTEPTRFWEVAPQTWRMVIDTNVSGPFLMAKNVAPMMVKAGWGRIINISVSRETMRRAGFSAIVVPPLLWLASADSDGVTGRRLVAARWQTGLGGREAAEAAAEQAGW
jgi:3-oxoacyl-[acyl-carrier protein] reductase